MATTNPGMKIKPPFGGQRSDMDRLNVPSDAAYLLRNWLKREGKFSVRPGFQPIATSLGETPTGMIQYDHHTAKRFTVVGTFTKWWNYNLSTRLFENITEAGNVLTGNIATNQLFRVFYKSGKSYLVGVNGLADAPKCWDGVTAAYANVGGSPPKAKCLAVCNGRLLLGHTYTAGVNMHQIDVSAFNDFEAGWGATQTVNLMDTPGEIVELRELGNLMTAVYKSDAIYIITPMDSGIEPFRFDLKHPNIKGPASPRLIVDTPSGHMYVASDGSPWIFDGINLSPLPEAIRQHILQTADLGALQYAHGFYDARLQEVWFIYRGLGSASCNMGVVINLPDMTIWPISFTSLRPLVGYGSQVVDAVRLWEMVLPLSSYTMALKGLSYTYYRVMLIDESGQVVTEGGTDDTGVSIPVEYESGLVVQEDSPRNMMTVVESEHFFTRPTSDQNISVQLGYSRDGEDPVYTTAKTLNLKSTARKVMGHRLTSRLFSLKFTASASVSFQWRGSVVNGALRGLR